MQTIKQENILKHNKNSPSLQKVTQQCLRGLVLFLLFFGVSCSDSTSSGGAGHPDLTGTPVDSAQFEYTNVIDYGQIRLRDGITNATYAIDNVTFNENPGAANEVPQIKVDFNDGIITIDRNLAVGTYTF